eukprot:gene5399-8242_t
MHLATGLHLGADISHVVAPQIDRRRGFHRTQCVSVLVNVESTPKLFLFNPYTTEIAGPLDLPFQDAVKGTVVWACAGVELPDDSYLLYIMTKQGSAKAHDRKLLVVRVSSRAFAVARVGVVDVEPGLEKLHLQGGDYWVALWKGGAVKKAPVVQDPAAAADDAGGELRLFSWSVARVQSELIVNAPSPACVNFGFTDEHLLAVAVANPASREVSVLSIDLKYGCQIDAPTTLKEPALDVSAAGVRTATVGFGASFYAATPGYHWAAFEDKLTWEPSSLESKSLAGALLARARVAAPGGKPVAEGLSAKKKRSQGVAKSVIARVDLSGTSSRDILSGWAAAIKAAERSEKHAPAFNAEADVLRAFDSKARTPSADDVTAALNACLRHRWWDVLDRVLSAASGASPQFVLIPSLCPSLLPSLAEARQHRLLKNAAGCLSGAVPTGPLVQSVKLLVAPEGSFNKRTLSVVDAVVSCGSLPCPLELAVELSCELPPDALLRLLDYLHTRLVSRLDSVGQELLDRLGVPSSERLVFWMSSLLDGSSDELVADARFHSSLVSLARLCRYAGSLAHSTTPLPGQLTAFVGTSAHRSSAAPDIDSKDFSLGPLRPRQAVQPFARYLVAF